MFRVAVVALVLNHAPLADHQPTRVKEFLTGEKFPAISEILAGWQMRPAGERAELVWRLTLALADRRRVKTTDTADLIIPYRLNTGELKFWGHGWIVHQDLFTVGGRAAWAIELLVESDPPPGVDKVPLLDRYDLPRLNEGLSAAEWAARVKEITEIVTCLRAVNKSQP